MSEHLAGIDQIIDDIGKPRPKSAKTRTVSVAEAAEILGVSRMALYQAVWGGKFPHIRVGRRILISTAKLDELLGCDPSDTPSPPLEAAE